MVILAGNRHLSLKVMLRGSKVWVNLIFTVIGVRLSFTGKHFDRNRYITRIFIFGAFFFYRSLWSHAKVLDPSQGVPKYFFRKLLFYFVVSNPVHILEVGKKIKSKLSNLSPLPTPRRNNRLSSNHQNNTIACVPSYSKQNYTNYKSAIFLMKYHMSLYQSFWYSLYWTCCLTIASFCCCFFLFFFDCSAQFWSVFVNKNKQNWKKKSRLFWKFKQGKACLLC